MAQLASLSSRGLVRLDFWQGPHKRTEMNTSTPTSTKPAVSPTPRVKSQANAVQLESVGGRLALEEVRLWVGRIEDMAK